MLNQRKGPAVREYAPKLIACVFHRQHMRYVLANTPNLTIFQQPVSDLLIDNDQVKGVVLGMGLKLYSRTVVITAGTFLAGQIRILG